MKFKFKGTHPTFFENKIIFILKSLGGKIAISDGYIYLKWSEKVSPIMIVIADHEIFKIWSWVIVDHSLARWSWVIVDHKKKYRPLLWTRVHTQIWENFKRRIEFLIGNFFCWFFKVDPVLYWTYLVQ